MKIIDHKDAINRRLYEGLMIVETPIYEPARCGASLVGGFADLRELAWGFPRCSDWRRVSCFNRTVLGAVYLVTEAVYLVAGAVYLVAEAVYLVAEAIYLAAEAVYFVTGAIYLVAEAIYLVTGAIYLVAEAVYLVMGAVPSCHYRVVLS